MMTNARRNVLVALLGFVLIVCVSELSTQIRSHSTVGSALLGAMTTLAFIAFFIAVLGDL